MKVKTSIYIDAEIWKEIKKKAIDEGKTVGEFIAGLFRFWKELIKR